MGLSLCLIVFHGLLIKFLLFTIFVSNYISFAFVQQPFCHDEERSALLQFKDSFVINKSASSFEGAYPKVLQWRSSNCCLWDGIDCDVETGHVIGLDLSSSFLYGSINSNSTLFSLVHLQMLSLLDNDFNFSRIPAAIGQLSHLNYLDLSGSVFYGQVPLEISNLTKLSSLVMSPNYDPVTQEKFLKLRNPNFEALVQNLSGLEVLILSYVDISSEVPNLLANFTSLTTLLLRDCELYGDFPAKIFQLPNLQLLSVRFNENLTGRLPEFHQRSPLTTLRLKYTKFFGSIPYSIEKLDSLDIFEARYCNFSGPIPISLAKLTQLTLLDLGMNNFNGDILSTLQNLTHLTSLSLDNNQIIGSIPPWLGNLTKLTELNLQDNLLHGPVPQSLSLLLNLEKLHIHHNNLGGNLKINMFFNIKNLTMLGLGHNNLSLILGKENRNVTSHQFKYLDLASCKLRKFPHFLKNQSELQWLDLGENKISGQMPNWMWNTSTDTLTLLNVGNNFLTGFNQIPTILSWVNLGIFVISSNMLRGPLPIPPASIFKYDASNNMLTGEISPLFCNMSSLYSLDLSNNNLGGEIPQCLGNSSNSLSVLNLRNNSFHGFIPQLCSNNASQLKMIDVSYNRLQGKLPRSLSNCLMLEAIVVSNNQLSDSFPSWLGSLLDLKLLILHQNGFYGAIEKPKQDLDFSNLRVLDLSSNNFTGELPSQYIFHWNAMKSIKSNVYGLTYLRAKAYYQSNLAKGQYYTAIVERYTITIMIKGVAMHYEAIQDIFAFIDLSDNKFDGEISDLFGNLKALHSLNLSNNRLTGCIPSSLGNILELESLDLSRNNLLCHIPQELKQLGFLSSFNVSHNNLTGPIPQGNQFSVFDNNSFYGNPELCGDPLSKKCGNSQSLPPLEEDHKDSESILKKYWTFILAGYISGLVVGVVLADIAMKRTPEWLVEKLSKKRKGRRGQRT